MRRLTLLIVALVMLAQPAFAWAGVTSEFDGVSVTETTTKSSKTQHRNDRVGGHRSDGPTPAEKAAQEVRDYKRRLSQYFAQLRTYDECLSSADVVTCRSPVEPGPLGTAFGKAGGLAADPTISDEDAAYIAFARLRLAPPSPVIGPSPNLNRWKMAAVGYPLWLSVAGDPTPPAVADAVADVHVRLQAHATKVVFSMGDRHTVTCTRFTTPWSAAAAGKKSPDCGYTYTKPSLPKRDYTVTATTYWSVAWSTSGGSGVIPFIQSSSTPLPVGELQVLVR